MQDIPAPTGRHPARPVVNRSTLRLLEVDARDALPIPTRRNRSPLDLRLRELRPVRAVGAVVPYQPTHRMRCPVWNHQRHAPHPPTSFAVQHTGWLGRRTVQRVGDAPTSQQSSAAGPCAAQRSPRLNGPVAGFDEPMVVTTCVVGAMVFQGAACGRRQGGTLMSRVVADCRDFPSESGCSLTIAGEEAEVLEAAAAHAVAVHQHQDGQELRDALRSSLKPEG